MNNEFWKMLKESASHNRDTIPPTDWRKQRNSQCSVWDANRTPRGVYLWYRCHCAEMITLACFVDMYSLCADDYKRASDILEIGNYIRMTLREVVTWYLCSTNQENFTGSIMRADSATAQAVSSWILTSGTWVQSWVTSCYICSELTGTEAGVSPSYFSFTR
jgi:hypothetical protein